ncbi:MAG: DNA polymerase III subunit delta [Acidobacteria bacterium]|nr:DNA polymerase III subunit delta [Acidobacteriota bacterium]
MRILPGRALENIQKGKLSNNYCLIGQQLYWRDRIWQALRETVGEANNPLASAACDLREEPLHKVLAAAQTLSLLAPRQLILVRNAHLAVAQMRRRGAAAAEGEEKTSAGASPLADYLRNPNPSTVLVLEMTDVDLESDDRRDKETAKARLEMFAELCDVVLLSAPSLGEAMELARQEAAQRGKTLSREAAEKLAMVFHRNLAQISLELEKHCLYIPEKKSLEMEDLDNLMPALNNPQVVGEAIGSGDARMALEALSGALAGGRYAPLVVSEIARYLRQLILLKENEVSDIRQAGQVLWAARLPAPQDTLSKLVRQARSLSGGFLLRGLQSAYEADVALRSSPPGERIVLERLTLRLTRRRTSKRKEMAVHY